MGFLGFNFDLKDQLVFYGEAAGRVCAGSGPAGQAP